jgi:hypothetical protein
MILFSLLQRRLLDTLKLCFLNPETFGLVRVRDRYTSYTAPCHSQLDTEQGRVHVCG